MEQNVIKIQEYLEKLSNKIPSIRSGLLLTNKINDFIEQVYGKIKL